MDQNPNNPVPYQLPQNQPRPPRKPLSLAKRIFIIIFTTICFFGIWDTFFPSKPPPAPKTNQPSNYPTIQQSNNPTSFPNWKTYTNQTYAYSVSYPNHLEPISQSPYTTKFSPKDTQQNPFPPLYISIIPNGFTNQNNEITGFLPQETINTFFTMRTNQTQSNFQKLATIPLAGTQAIIIQNDNIPNADPGLSERRVILQKNNLTYILGSYYQTQQQLNDLRDFLSNFKSLYHTP